MVLFSKQGLTPGNHTIKIVAVAGSEIRSRRNQITVLPGSIHVPIDAFSVLDGRTSPGEVRMVVNNLWNYTKMGLGNYMKDPVLIHPGYSNKVVFKISN
jgi:hypothetical protein